MGQADDVYLRLIQARYRKAGRKEKSGILDEFAKTTGYHRKHATALLKGRRGRVRGPIRHPRRAQYGAEEADALVFLALLLLRAGDRAVARQPDAGHSRPLDTCSRTQAQQRAAPQEAGAGGRARR